MYKLRNIFSPYHVMNRAGIYYYVRRIPTDLKQHYSVKRLCFSLRTKSHVLADEVRQQTATLLPAAVGQYLKLLGIGKAKTFHQAAVRKATWMDRIVVC